MKCNGYFRVAALALAVGILVFGVGTQNADAEIAKTVLDLDPPPDGTVGTGGTDCLVQGANQVNGLFSDTACGLCPTGMQFVAEAFVIGANDGIDGLRFWGGYYPGNTANNPDCFNVYFFDNAGGVPGAKINTLDCIPATTRDATGVILFGVEEYEYYIDLEPNKELAPGTYWVGITNNSAGNPIGDFWFWETGDLDPNLGILGQVWGTDTKNGPWNSDSTYDMSLEVICKGGGGGEDIPTVSEWGLIGIGLMTVVLGAIVFGRRRTAVAGGPDA